ncbi:hybrid sensor histidine kinase/response regulator [Spirosoma koreense]
MATKLLVIEDEFQIRENMAELLTLKGYVVDTAANGREGIMQALLNRPDLILCDVMMPLLDGYQVLDAIRTNRSLATVPFIFLTAKADPTYVRRGMVLGADDYLTKPLVIRDLLAAIESRLDQEKRRTADVQTQVEKYWHQLGKVSAHEYNTPLAGIMGFAHLLRDDYDSFDKEQAQSMLDMMITSCLRLKRTLDNSRLVNELTRPAPADQPLSTVSRSLLSAELVNQILVTISEQMDRETRVDVDVESAEVRIFEDHLRKVLEELIDNALKFSPTTGTVRIEGHSLETRYRLTITNSGKGFTAENIAGIGPYTQFERNAHEQQGAGSGLFIAKKLVELHQGQLMIDSAADGPTTVSVELLVANA